MDANTSSSGAVRLQGLVPLTPTPFVVSAAAADDALRAPAAADAPSAAPAVATSASATTAARYTAAPVFLCAATPALALHGAGGSSSNASQQQQWVLATVQSNGVYLYNTNNQHCLLSFSIPPAVRLACPACFIPSKDFADIPSSSTAASPAPRSPPKQQPAAATAADILPPAATASPAKFGGRAYVVVDKGPSVTPDERARQVWGFETSKHAASVQTPGKPSFVKTLPKRIHKLFAQGEALVVVFENGAVQALTAKLDSGAALWPASPKQEVVIWSQLAERTGREVLCLVVRLGKTVRCRLLSRAANSSGKLESECEVTLATKNPVSYALSENRQLTVVERDGSVKVFGLSERATDSALEPRAVIPAPTAGFDQSGFNNLSVAAIKDGYFAIVGSRLVKNSGMVK
ncbi:hypothetical protein HK405_008016 [Cladochytrium tenue]|nr:hypothetical protein HK405_008016 [Cladochytrium tenue]